MNSLNDSPPGEELFHFKAGLMKWDGRICTADPRLGYVSLVQCLDGLLHLLWISRDTQSVEEDLIIVNDGFLRPINNEIARRGRCYSLQFLSSDKKMVFWLQEPDQAFDQTICKRFNDITECMDPLETNSELGDTSDILPETLPKTESKLKPETPTNTAVPSFDLSSLMRSFTPINLQETLKPATLIEMVGNLSDESRNELFNLLPSGQQNMEGFRDAVRSTQMSETTENLSNAIYSDQVSAIITSLGGNPQQIGSNPMDAFVKAFENKYKSEDDQQK